MKKDWTGSKVSNIKTMGASNHSNTQRQSDDFYATEPKAVNLLLGLEKFEGSIWECACGAGHLSKEMKRLGYEVLSTDLVYRGYGLGDIDFLKIKMKSQSNIITNPPYKYANEFILKGMDILEKGKKLALFLPIRYLEGKERKLLFQKFPPKTVWVSSSRLKCAPNGEFNKEGSSVSYAWFVWQKGYSGQTQLKWFN